MKGLALAAIVIATTPAQAATLLYSQNFENPATFVNYSTHIPRMLQRNNSQLPRAAG